MTTGCHHLSGEAIWGTPNTIYFSFAECEIGTCEKNVFRVLFPLTICLVFASPPLAAQGSPVEVLDLVLLARPSDATSVRSEVPDGVRRALDVPSWEA